MNVQLISRTVLLILVSTTIISGAALPAAAVPAPSPVVQVPEIDWQPCERRPEYDCAVAGVPVDYDDPGGPQTEIALARFPASNPEERIGSVFVNPGGPGGSGVSWVLSGFGSDLGDHLAGRFDVVGFDPRGVGRSDPLRCFDSDDDREEFLEGLPVFPYARDQQRPFYTKLAGLYDECSDRPSIVRSMSTADVARDLDVLRQAVGDDQLTYYGISYGSYLGTTYANLFPDNIRALVIDGVLNPRLWSRGWQIRSDRVATAEEFAEFLRLCDEAAQECAFWTAEEGSAARWKRLARALRDEPIELPEGPYSYDFLIGDATSAMYSPEYWGGPGGWGAFFDYIADAALGESADAQVAMRVRDELYAAMLPEDAAGYQNGLDAYYGNQCADTDYPANFLSFQAIGEYALEGSRFGPLWWWSNTPCTHWPTAPDRYAGPWRAETSQTVLVVGNYFDGVTDYAGARASARMLDGRLLSYAGWGHGAYERSGCVTESVVNYLVDLTLPAEGTVCPANPNPFLEPGGPSSPVLPLTGLPPIWSAPR